jgi:hypothetical protein
MLNQRPNYNYSNNKRRNVAKNGKVVYDWITISSRYSDYGMSLDDVLENVFQVSQTKNLISGTTWTKGMVVNNDSKRALWISANDDGYMKIRVCPPKFLKGNNVEEASIKETLDLFTTLSNMVGYDLGATSKVDRLDITHTAMTEYDPIAYYPYLCYQTGTENKRWVLDSTLYYGTSKAKQKKFYDKVRDTQKTGGRQRIPIQYQGTNMTRFEVCLGTNKRVSDVLGEVASLGHLFKEEYIVKLHNYWRNEYDIIPKETEIQTQFNKGMKQKEVQEEIIRAGLSALGRLQVEEAIERAGKIGALSYSAKSKARQNLLKPFEDRAVKSDLIDELDTKMFGFEPKWD